MAVNKKGMRKVKAGGRQYFWTVRDGRTTKADAGFVEHSEPERVLHIISTNKKFIVHYHIPQTGDPHARLRVEGPLFPRAPMAKEIKVPRWRHDSKRYPTGDFVRRLIDWCMQPA